MVWKLNDIIEPEEIENLSEKVKNDLENLSKLTDTFIKTESTEDYKKIVLLLENVQEKLNRIYGYSSLSVEKNNKDEVNIYRNSKAKNLISLYDDKTRKFIHFVKGLKVSGNKQLNDKTASNLFKQVSKLEYRYQYIRKLAHRTLSEKEEEVINKKNLNLLTSIHELRSLIETDQVYVFSHPQTKKKEKHYNSALLLKKVYSRDEKVRENTYKALLKPYIDNIQKYYSIYEAVIKDWNQEVKWRKYESAIQMRNEENDISDKTVDSLILSVKNNTEIFRKFFRLKADLYGVNKISRYDIYAPLYGSTEEEEFSFEKGKDLVLDVLKDFDNEFYKNGLSMFEQKHIDSEPIKDKSSGAFCATISPKLKPFILLNYADTKRDVLTLAHELGHSIHSIFSEDNFPSTQEAPLILAETASTLSEMMVFEYLYSQEKDKDVKRQMLADKITDSYATICRQIYFILFEIEAHKKVPNGIQLNDFNKLYLHNLHDLFGDSVKVDEIFKYEWAYIPHIVNAPFYCYSYAFGNLLSLAIFKLLKSNKNKYLENVKNILRAGGSQNPEQLLKQNGININEANFWQYGFDQINDWIKELNALS